MNEFWHGTRLIDAAEALRLRIVTAVVEPARLTEEAIGTARMIARAPRPLLIRTKAKAISRASTPSTASTTDI